jgi:hypothetical protein
MQRKAQARRESSGSRPSKQPPKPRAARAHRAATSAAIVEQLNKTPLFRDVSLLTSGPDLAKLIEVELARVGIVALLITGQAKPWRIRWIEDKLFNHTGLTAKQGAEQTDAALASAGIPLRGVVSGELDLSVSGDADESFSAWGVELAGTWDDLSSPTRDLLVTCRAYEQLSAALALTWSAHMDAAEHELPAEFFPHR